MMHFRPFGIFTVPLPARAARLLGVGCSLALLLGIGISARAATFGGEWANAVEFLQDERDTGRPGVDLYENLGLFARKIGGSDFSAFTTLAFTDRFESGSRKGVEIDHLYLEWENPDHPLSVRAGRQRVFEAITPEYLDGVMVSARLGERLSARVFGGLTVPSRFSTAYVHTAMDSNAVNYGLRLDARLPASCFGFAYQHEVAGGGGTLAQAIMVDAEQRLGSLGSFFGLFSYDPAEGSVREYEIGTRLSPTTALTLDIGFLGDYGEPDTAALFADYVFENYREFAARLLYRLGGRASIAAGYFLRSLEETDTPAHGAEGRVSLDDRYSIGFAHQWGLAGRSSRVDGAVEVLRSDFVRSGVAAYLRRFHPSQYNRESHEAWAADLYVALGPKTGWWSAKTTLQAAGNHYYDYDVRLYVETIVRYSRFTR